MRYFQTSLSIIAALLAALLIAPFKAVAEDRSDKPVDAYPECPVVFHGLPSRIDPGDLQHVKLLAPQSSIEKISILKPSSSGFFAIRARRSASEAVYGTYRAESVRFTEYRISDGLGAVEWGTVAERIKEFESEVTPGTYRLVLRYLAAGQEQTSSTEATDVPVCIAISAPFELSRSFLLLELSGDR